MGLILTDSSAYQVSIPVFDFDELDSTSSEAMRRAARGERGPIWIRAVRQSRGRGRSGRSWAMLEGNLAASLLFEPGCPPGALHQLSLLAGVAIHDALHILVDTSGDPLRARLKWPNDLMIGASKVGGILVESSTFEGRLVAVVGVGINVAAAPAIPGRATTALVAHCRDIPAPEELLHAIDRRFRAWLRAWDEGAGFEAVRSAWLERGLRIGEPLTINERHGLVSGSFAGLDDDGALLMRTGEGLIERFATGDVSLVDAGN
ncbi:MAG: biotin--[acetyl-CoA-carboxylase] ligase [Hyphomicrobiaceae bacterium]